MAAAVRTSVTELPESRVRVDAEIPAQEVERRVEQKARALGRDLRIPGFRKGKVPPPMVIARLGREAVLDEAIRETLGRWYTDAIDASGITPVGDPKLDLGEPPAEGQDLRFSIEVGVRPVATLGAYRELEVPRREAQVPEADIDAEVQGLRERLARLETAERAAASGDFVVIDYLAILDGAPFPGAEGSDQLVELGGGRLIPGFEEQLLGAEAGDERTLSVTFPEDYENADLAGRPATFEVTVKEVREKLLPEVDDDFAAEVGFDTVAELRDDIGRRLREADEQRVESEFRAAALDAAVAAATVEVPAALTEARAAEMWERTLHTLSHQGITREAYLQISGREEAEILAEAAPEAKQALRRDAVIAAVIEAEQIEPTDEEVLEALGPLAEREGVKPDKLLADLRRSGRLADVREDLAARRAMELIAESATAIPAEQAAARERLWTPDKPEGAAPAAASSALWTPGS